MHLKHVAPLIAINRAAAQTLNDMLVQQNATLSVLNGFLDQRQELLNTFSNAKDITVLAPSNNALNSLSSDMVNKVSTDPTFLTALLKYHVLNGTYYTSNFTGASNSLFIPTFMNETTYTNVTGGQRMVSSVNSNGDLQLSSGPQDFSKVQNTVCLLFPSLPHLSIIITLSNIRGNQNFNFTGGTLHIIDALLSMPSNLTATLLNANLTAAVGALRQSGIAADLDQESEITVFAPNNHGFEAVGNLVAGMAAGDLHTVLNYHIIKGKVLYSSLVGNGTEKTAQGGDVTFRVENGLGGKDVFVNSAKIVQADVLCANGVVHVIDKFVFPFSSFSLLTPLG